MEKQYCDKCFKDLSDEPHQSWCPYCMKETPADLPEGFDELFKGFKK